MNGLSITEVRFTIGTPDDETCGLLGYTSFLLNGCVRIDGVAVRRTRDGRRVLAFPVKHDRKGRQRPLVRPIDDAARRDIEAQVLTALAHQLDSAP